MRTFLVFILIQVLTALLVACTSEPAPPLPQASNDEAAQAPATAAPTALPTTETSNATTPPLPTAPTDAPEPTATATTEPTSTTEPGPTATPTPTTATAPPTPTPPAEPPTLTPPSTSGQPRSTATAAVPTLELRVTVSPIPSNLPAYDRHDWKHWTDADGDCQDARQEVLVAESRIGPDFRTDRKCRVSSGEWLAPYTGTVVTDPGKLDVDHMVPLGNAHLSGAWQWPAQRREQYANYLDDPQHLIAVTASANRSKGARGPEDWKPEDRSYWCQYAVDWITIKDDWGLTVTQREHDALVDMLNTCSDPPGLWVSHGSIPGQHRPTATPEPNVAATPAARRYDSCDAAQAAGERRVQGSKGGGRGFPKWMVPSARDGDGDGVVCEK